MVAGPTRTIPKKEITVEICGRPKSTWRGLDFANVNFIDEPPPFLLWTHPDYMANMSFKQPQTSLFQVYLRLRPPIAQKFDEADRFLAVEPPESSQDGTAIVAPVPTHITLQPPTDSRKRAVEKFGFTKVFEENASQLDVFHDTGMESMIRGVLKESRDGLVATLGVTGSGKVRISSQ